MLVAVQTARAGIPSNRPNGVNMTKVTFDQVAKAATDLQQRGANLWTLSVTFAVTAMTAAIKTAHEDEGEALRDAWKLHEAQYKSSNEVNLNTIGAYRSAKSVISAAARYNVPLVEKDKVRGKTEVEKAIDAVREKQSAAATIQRSLTTVDNKLAEVTKSNELAAVYLLIDALHKKCAQMIEKAGVKKSDIKKAKEELVEAG